MGQIKQNCRFIPKQATAHRLKGVHPDWEMHPDWIVGIEALDSYNHWVSEVVLPIAFQWIEENKDEVYANIPEELTDDVGVVVASAFEIIKKKQPYKDGMKQYRTLSTKGKGKALSKPRNANPIWSEITKSLRNSRKQVVQALKPHLKDTIK